MNVKFISLLVLLAGLASCGSNDTKIYAGVEEMAEAARSKVDIISPADFKAVLESEKHFYLIDCRESEEFDIACIKGAISVPRGVLENEIADQAPKKRVAVYIYCDNGQRSALAATVLPRLKYTNVQLIDGGFDAWQQLYPELVEQSPVRGAIKKAAAAPSGGCGG